MTTRRHDCRVALPTSVERTFALLLEPSAIRAWWGAARVVVVPRVGGDWIAAWGPSEDAPDYVSSATIAALESPHRLHLVDFRYSARGKPDLPFDARAISVEFRVTSGPDGGSVLEITQDGFPVDAAADEFFAGCERGWRDTLVGIERVAGGEITASAAGFIASAIPELVTDRLRLRGFNASDIGSYARFCAQPEVMQFLGGRIWSRTESWRHVAMLLGHWQLRGFGFWAVERLSDGAFLGRVGCFEPDGWPGFEIGWMIGREHQGQGYATEAARAALDWAHEVLGRQRVIHLIGAGNLASEAVARKLDAVPGATVEVMGFDVVVWEGRA